MRLAKAALEVLSATQSGTLEAVELRLRELSSTIFEVGESEQPREAMAILQEARRAIYAHRAHIITNLQQLERTSLYGQSPVEGTSWEVAA